MCMSIFVVGRMDPFAGVRNRTIRCMIWTSVGGCVIVVTRLVHCIQDRLQLSDTLRKRLFKLMRDRSTGPQR
jgi:hypothetical protein